MPTAIGKDPSLYPFVGPRYQGEYEGYIYDPYADQAGAEKYYRRDPKASKEYYQRQGLLEKEPEPPTMLDQVAPLAIATGAVEGAKVLGPKLVTGAGDALNGLIGQGTTQQVGQQMGQQVAQEVGRQAATEAGSQAVAEGGMSTGYSTPAGAPIGSMGTTPLYVPAAVAAQTILSGKSALDMLKGDTKRIDQMGLKDVKDDPTGTIGRLGLLIASGGLSEIGNSLLSHKSTKKYQQERRDKLAEQGITGLQTFDKVAKENAGKVIRDPNFKGDSAYDNVSVLGNYETFGNDWDALDLEKKAQVVKAIGDAGLYVDDKGDRLIKDKEAARKIKEDVLAGLISVDPGVNPYQTVG